MNARDVVRNLRLTPLTVVVVVLATVVDAGFTAAIKGNDFVFRPSGATVPGLVLLILIILAGVVLLGARRWPYVSFGIVAVLALLASLTTSTLYLAQPAVALYWLARSAARRVSIGALAVLLVIDIVAGMSANESSSVGAIAFTAAFLWLTALVGWVLGLVHKSTQTRHEADRRRLQAESEQARHDERHRIARELHDIISHSVSVMTLQAAGARTLVGRDDAKISESLGVIERSGVQAMSELNRLLSVVRAEGDAEPDNQPSLTDVSGLVETARATGQEVELAVEGRVGDLDPSVGLACYRIVQEGLTNARKYAGQGSIVRVRMSWIPPSLVLTVVNDAGLPIVEPSRPVLHGGHGLDGLTERAELVGGQLEAGPLPDGGFRIRATLPVAAVRRAPGLAAPRAEQTWPSLD